MTGYVMSHLSKWGDIHIHTSIFAPKAEITLQFLQATWLDCEAGSAIRKRLKRWPETLSSFPHPLTPGRHRCIRRQPTPACRTHSPEMQMCNSLPKHCEQHQQKAAAGCFNPASSAIFPVYRQVPDTDQLFCHLCSLCRMPHLPWMNHGLKQLWMHMRSLSLDRTEPAHSSVNSVSPET